MKKKFKEKVLNNNFLFNVRINNSVKEIIAYFKKELKRELAEKDELNFEFKKVTSELEGKKKSKRKSAMPKEAKLKSMPAKRAVQ